MTSDIIINNEQDMLCAVVATLFTPERVTADQIRYDKETILLLAKALEDFFVSCYNVTLDMTIEGE